MTYIIASAANNIASIIADAIPVSMPDWPVWFVVFCVTLFAGA